MRHARDAGAPYQHRARHKSEKSSWVTRFAEKLQSPERSSRREKAARALGMLATIGATLTAATGISLYHDSGNMEPVGNLLNPVAEHVMTTDEEIAAAEGFSNIDGLEHRQMEEAVMHGVACGTEAMALSSITLYLLYGRAHRSSRQEGSVISV
jgi:hypothetical protein